MASVKHTYETLESAFLKRDFRPLYLLSGSESFLMDRLQQLAIDHAIAPHEKDFNFDLVYGAESNAGDVISLCSGFPMMAERRLVIVRNFEKLKNNVLFKDYAARPNPMAVVILIAAGKVPGNRNPYRALNRLGISAVFSPLKQQEVNRWVNRLVGEQGKSIEPEAARMLIDFIGPDLTNLSHEIDKLAAFSGERPSIRVSDVLQVGGHSAEINVFELQNAVSRGDQKTALKIAERILQQSTNRQGEALRILAILSLFFNRLWQYTACKREGLNQAQSAERLGLGRFPFMLRDYDAALGLYTYSAIRRAISTLLAADSELKGGSTRNPNLILTLSLRRLVP